MAISIIETPPAIHSGYNPAKYVISSDNRAKNGFRYVVEVIDYTTSKTIAEFKIIPDINNNNYGTVDISKILQNKLDTTIFFGDFVNDYEAFFNYRIRFGESLPKQWRFQDYVYLDAPISPNTDLVGGLGLTTSTDYDIRFSNEPHGYQVGDVIQIQNGTNYPSGDPRNLLNGVHTVVQVISPTTIRIGGTQQMIGNYPYGVGYATPSDNSKTVTYNLASYYATAINTAMNIEEFVNETMSTGDMGFYDLSNGGDRLLTNQPDVIRLTNEQLFYANFLKGSGNYIHYKNDAGEEYRRQLSSVTTVGRIKVGGEQMPSMSPVGGATGLLKKPDTKSYEYWIADSNGVPKSKKYKIILDKRCKINDTQIIFMDRKGNWSSFAFQYRKYEYINNDKSEYNKYTDLQNTYDKGDTVYYSDMNKTMTLHTNFMGEDMNLYYEELITSRHTYIFVNGNWYACTIEDRTVENEFKRNNKMIKKEINIKISINNPIN